MSNTRLRPSTQLASLSASRNAWMLGPKLASVLDARMPTRAVFDGCARATPAALRRALKLNTNARRFIGENGPILDSSRAIPVDAPQARPQNCTGVGGILPLA